MSDFTAYGYQILEQLGRNTYGGRVTYKAINLNDRQPVVIKQFQFARDSNWDDYKAIEQEINTLKTLNYPGIPRYLAHFDPGDGICLVQEYKNARSLSLQVNYDPDRIQTIAISLLEILVYLQNLIPPVIHRDLKPENILVDDRLNVYLVDFGFSRMGEGSVALSSVTAGTFGFMPPEQLHNLQLSKASDLYSLGATIICLITRTKSTEIGKLMNLSNGRLQFHDRTSGFTIEFSEWLEKMVEPDPDRRFPSAEIALKALLKPTRVNLPEVQISHSVVEFNATRFNERLIQTIWIKNSVPETILEGNWQVVADRKDPPHTPDSHAWISFAPRKFKSNLAECNVSIDTSKLKADSLYERWLLLQTNTTPNNYTIKLRVKTASVPEKISKLPYFYLLLPLIFAFATTVLFGIAIIFYKSVLVTAFRFSLLEGIFFFAIFFSSGIFGGFSGLCCGALPGFLLDMLLDSIDNYKWSKYGAKLGIILGIVVGLWLGSTPDPYETYLDVESIHSFRKAIIVLLASFTIGLIAIIKSAKKAVKELRRNNIQKSDAVLLSGFMLVLGMSLGVGLIFGLFNPLVILTLAGTTLPVGTLLFSYATKRRKQLKKREQQEQYLIEP